MTDPSLRMDHKTTPKWAWLGSRDPIFKFWDLNFWTNQAIHIKFDMQLKDGPFLRTDHKLSWLGGSWLVFAWHLQNTKRKSMAY